LGNVFEKQGLEEDVLKAYEKSIEASRKNPDVWNEAGNIYYHTGAYEDAIASYSKAIELDPAEATFSANLAKARQALANTNNQDEARPESAPEQLLHSGAALGTTAVPAPEEEKALPSAPASAERPHVDENIPAKVPSLPNRTAEHASEAPYWIFGTESARAKVLEPAAQYSSVGAPAVVSTLKTLPTYGSPSHREQAYSGGHAGLPDTQKDASALLVQLTPRPASPARLNPGNPPTSAAAPARPAADQAPVNNSVLENDIARYRKITEMNPRNDRAWDALGNMYEAAGLHSEAIAAFEQAIGLAPQKEAYHFHLGIALAYQMHYENAILALQNSIALNPNFVLGHCALAANYRRIGKETEAQDHIAIARPSMELEKEYNRACFESISGNADQAFALLETALEKGQIQIAMLRSDTDLDFIRNDARFEAILYKTMDVAQ
jgi:tetratricopeptide (TPR) repeat protein